MTAPPAVHQASRTPDEGHIQVKCLFTRQKQLSVVLENSNVEKLASNQYLLVQSRSKEDRYDINDASAGEIYPILVSESTVSVLQSSRRREHRASVVDRQAQTHRTAALHGMRPGVFRTGGDLDGPEQTP